MEEHKRTTVDRIDQTLGRLLMRFFASLAFLAAAGSAVFGMIVLCKGHVVGILVLSSGAMFLWLGMRAWRDRATLTDALNRDCQPSTAGKPGTRDGHHG